MPSIFFCPFSIHPSIDRVTFLFPHSTNSTPIRANQQQPISGTRGLHVEFSYNNAFFPIFFLFFVFINS
ncbi:hypothetical protein VTJ04DRAFT_546 [Mycothermus thermophilus]|uniref:uncharacterized protein n=1 Tax=Humicola insolens TaxID=85995 RepID=UPI003742B365